MLEIEEHANFQATFKDFHQLLFVIPGDPKSANDSKNSLTIADSVDKYLKTWWPDLQCVYNEAVSVSTNAFIFQNVVILVVTFTKIDEEVSRLISRFKSNVQRGQTEPFTDVDMGKVKTFLEEEDEANKTKVSTGLQILQIRKKIDESVTVSKMSIVKKTDSVVEDVSFSALEIRTSCFTIKFECKKDQHSFKRSKVNSDIDNVHTCYQNAFYKCVKKMVTGTVTDARVRQIWALDWCSFRDADDN